MQICFEDTALQFASAPSISRPDLSEVDRLSAVGLQSIVGRAMADSDAMIELVPYDPAWAGMFARERATLDQILSPLPNRLSTSWLRWHHWKLRGEC